MTGQTPGGYAGDVSARFAFEDLSRTADATLVDVRTAAEWIYVGVPLLSGIGKETILIEWEAFPTGERVPDFVARLDGALAKQQVGREAPVYFICRSGARSRHAAVLATEAGYRRAYNVEFGFEGRLGPDKHRATAGSWKAEGLPWVQS